MADILHAIHSMVRYLVLLAGVLTVVAAVARLRSSGPAGADRTAMTAFVAILDVQVLLGLVLLAAWPYYPMLIGHIAMMVLAAAVAHGGSMMARRREPARPGAPVRAAAVGLALVLVVGGIMAIQRPVL
ncbi:MAG TPA: hypothetical protein VK936_15260 [Longimicrobiales bacterium]|nr:hypothetical protein [Longimicrobiales bacterium]